MTETSDGAASPVALCFVCHGNICRSPTAAAVMRKLVSDAGLEGAIEIDSAGVSAEHTGEAPDRRSSAAAGRRGFVLDGVARQLVREDFARFDLILLADADNLRRLQRIALPPGAPRRAVARLLREYDPAMPGPHDVPDPWADGPDAFEVVLDICERSCGGLLDALRRSHPQLAQR